MAIDYKKRSGTAVGNFNFKVEIFDLAANEGPVLSLPVNAVRSLGDARTNVMRHRISGSSAPILKALPGLSTADSVTLEGNYLFNAADIIELQKWRDQVKGKVEVTTAGYYREITIMPITGDLDDENIPITIVSNTIKLQNAFCTKLTFSDFDVNSPAASNWTLEIEFEDMVVTSPEGV